MFYGVTWPNWNLLDTWFSSMSGVKKGKVHKQKKNTISIVKHGERPDLLWGCFAAAGSGNLDCMKDIMDSLKYQAILAKNVMPSVQRLKLEAD